MNRITRIIRDVPDSRVHFVIAMMEDDGAEVTKIEQGDGLWTITGVFPHSSNSLTSSSAVGQVGRRTEPPDPSFGRTHDIDILARTIWGEARGGSRLGMEAVAAVVLNRVNHNNSVRFGSTIADVCLKPNQFSCWNPDDRNLEKLKRINEMDQDFATCIEIAERAVRGVLTDPTNGSDHYHAITVAPDWSKGKSFARRIDDHIFFNNIS